VTADENVVLAALQTRRVVRQFLPDPVAADDIRTVIRAGTWASSAGNRSIHRFLVVRDAEMIGRLKPFAPGILARPPAVIVVSTDSDLARQQYVQLGRDRNTWIDIGTSLMCMMLAAQTLGLGTCPVTSFSQPAVARVLDLPDRLEPELILQIGRAAPRPARPASRRPAGFTAAALTDWEQVGTDEPGA
jgi:nitroreductase